MVSLLVRKMRAAVPTFSASLLLACAGSSVPRPHYAPQTTAALVAVPHEPPPARVETAPREPKGTGAKGVGAVVWIDGEWTWKRRRWAWVPGRWVEPLEGAVYSPWVTVRGSDGTLYFAPSVWHDAKGASIVAPKALATATVDSGAVVDAEGDMERTTVVSPP